MPGFCIRPQPDSIGVEGHLDRAHWPHWFGGMQLTPREDGMTLLSGPVADQAALHGLLARIRDLGLVLVSLERTGGIAVNRRCWRDS